MAENPLNYTNLSYNEIMTDIKNLSSKDSRFETFRESSMYGLLSEIFAASTDFTNYYIERRAEESFLDTAKLRSSVVLLARMLGYITRRPLPAKTQMKIVLKGPLPSGLHAGDKVVFEAYKTKFTFNGQPFVLTKTLTMPLLQRDIDQGSSPDFRKEFIYSSSQQPGGYYLSQSYSEGINGYIDLVQGESKHLTISGHKDFGKTFQIIKLEGLTDFSNYFGEEDFGCYDESEKIQLKDNVTRVGYSNSITDAKTYFETQDLIPNPDEFYIDRRTFVPIRAMNDINKVDNSVNGEPGKNSRFCIIRTTLDDSVEILFADDKIAKMGPDKTSHLHVKYFSTLGSGANAIGVAGSPLQIDGEVKFITNKSSTGSLTSSNFEFYLTKNITGGTDSEDIDSIKVNAPQIFSSLDRCVTSKDYISYLRTLTQPFPIKNAIAWGEQEEIKGTNTHKPNQKFFNVSPFCASGEIYDEVNGMTLEPSSYILSNKTNEFESTNVDIGKFDYFNTFVLDNPMYPLEVSHNESSQVGEVYKALSHRAQATVKNIYISPIVQRFRLVGNIYIAPLTDRTLIKEKINKAIAKHLNLNGDFSTPIYISNITEIVEQYNEVKNSDIALIPYNIDEGLSQKSIVGEMYPINLTRSKIYDEWNEKYKAIYLYWAQSGNDIVDDNNGVNFPQQSFINAVNYRNEKIVKFFNAAPIGTEWSFENFKKYVSYDPKTFIAPVNVRGAGYVEQSDLIEYEFNQPSLYSAQDLYKKKLIELYLKNSTDESLITDEILKKVEYISSIVGLPRAETIKYDSEVLLTRPVWPNRLDYRWDATKLSATNTKPDVIDSNLLTLDVTEREFFIRITKSFYSRLTDGVAYNNSTTIDKLRTVLDYSNKCVGCSLSVVSSLIQTNSSPISLTDVNDFIQINNDTKSSMFLEFASALEDSFGSLIKQNMIDSKGNLSNFSLKNELAAVELFGDESITYK